MGRRVQIELPIRGNSSRGTELAVFLQQTGPCVCVCVCVCWEALKARVFSGAARRRPHMLICRRRNSFSQRVLIELDVLARARDEEKTETLAV